MKILLIFILPILVHSKCLYKVNEFCQVALDQLSPTQVDIGPWNIEKKLKKIESFKSTEDGIYELQKYLLKKAIPVVISPDKKLYMTDRHHTHYALLKSLKADYLKKAYIKIIFDGSNLTSTAFWEMMKKKKWVYTNSNGEEIKVPEDLPLNLSLLEEDHYRGLISFMNDNEECFKKVDVPFLEHYWADHFRAIYTGLNSSNLKDLTKASNSLRKYCSDPSSSHLPGFQKITLRGSY